MSGELVSEVTRLHAAGRTPGQIRLELINKGFAFEDVEDALSHIAELHHTHRSGEDRLHTSVLSFKELLDRVGFGLGNNQFVNILFYLLSQSLFLVGFFVGLRAVLSMLLSTLLHSFAVRYRANRRLMSAAGVLFGFSFLFMAFAVVLDLPWLFAVSLLAGSLGVVTYGDLYHQVVRESVRKERTSRLLKYMSFYGIIVTAFAIVLSGWLMDFTPIGGRTVTLSLVGQVYSIHMYGFVLTFLITALCFIISGYLLSYIKEFKEKPRGSLALFFSEYRTRMHDAIPVFRRNPYVGLLLFATMLTGLVQILGNAYYGIFIFETFRYQYAQGFMNVALVFAPALLVAFVGPVFSHRVQRTIGLAPALVFGTLLMAMMPAVLVFKPLLPNIVLANIFAVIGAAMVGVSQDLLSKKLMGESERRKYFTAVSIVLAIPYLILLPIGAFLASSLTLSHLSVLFLIVAAILVVIVAPLYILLVTMSHNDRL